MIKAKYLESLKELNIQQGRELTPDINLHYKTKDSTVLITPNEAVVLQFHPQINNKMS